MSSLTSDSGFTVLIEIWLKSAFYLKMCFRILRKWLADSFSAGFFSFVSFCVWHIRSLEIRRDTVYFGPNSYFPNRQRTCVLCNSFSARCSSLCGMTFSYVLVQSSFSHGFRRSRVLSRVRFQKYMVPSKHYPWFFVGLSSKLPSHPLKFALEGFVEWVPADGFDSSPTLSFFSIAPFIGARLYSLLWSLRCCFVYSFWPTLN